MLQRKEIEDNGGDSDDDDVDDDDEDDVIMMMPLLLALTAPSTLPPHRNANEVRARRPDHGDVDRLQLFGKTWQKGRLGV